MLLIHCSGARPANFLNHLARLPERSRPDLADIATDSGASKDAAARVLRTHHHEFIAINMSGLRDPDALLNIRLLIRPHVLPGLSRRRIKKQLSKALWVPAFGVRRFAAFHAGPVAQCNGGDRVVNMEINAAFEDAKMKSRLTELGGVAMQANQAISVDSSPMKRKNGLK